MCVCGHVWAYILMCVRTRVSMWSMCERKTVYVCVKYKHVL